MDTKTKQLNLDTYQEGLKQLATNMATMLHDAFTAYLNEMNVTYTAIEAAEWLGGTCLVFLQQVGKYHNKLHSGQPCLDARNRLCFCGVVDFAIRDSCPIAQFIHLGAVDDDETADITLQ